MFIFSFKFTKKNIAICLGALAIILLIVLVLLFGKGNSRNNNSCNYKLDAQDNRQRIEFLSQFGWEVKEDPIEVTEAIIPMSFNDTYKNYNDIQIGQGLDLAKYKGESCKKFVYELRNYPGRSKGMRASLLVLNGKVIGGDISSVEMNGIMHGFENPNKANDEDKAVNTTKVLTEKTTQTTERETLAPDPKMPQAPTD